jgi:hypothetical protein
MGLSTVEPDVFQALASVLELLGLRSDLRIYLIRRISVESERIGYLNLKIRNPAD